MYFGAFIIAPLEVVLVIAIISIVFGSGRLARFGQSLGEMVSNFRQASKNDKNSDG